MLDNLPLKSIKRLAKPVYYFIKRIVFRVYLYQKSSKIPSYRNVLIIAPHPDDEVFGTCGFVLDCLSRGSMVNVLFMTRGEASHENIDKNLIAEKRALISKRVLEDMGVSPSSVVRWQLPDGAMPFEGSPGFDDAVCNLVDLLMDIRPDAVFVTDILETWPYDHISAFKIAKEAVRKADFSCDLYGYFVWLWYSFPVKKIFSLDTSKIYRLHILNNVNLKQRFITRYLCEVASNGKPWSGTLPYDFLKAFNYPYEFFRLVGNDR